MGRIQIDTDKAVILSAAVKTFKSNYDNFSGDMKSAVSSMSSNWISAAGSSAVSSYNSVSDSLLTSTDQAINIFSQFLDQVVAQGYTSTESENVQASQLI